MRPDQKSYDMLVSENNQLQERLEKCKSELERNTKLIDNSPIVLFEFKMSPEGKYEFTYINKSVTLTTGLSSEEIIGDASIALDLVQANYKEQFWAKIQKSAQKLSTYHDTIPILLHGEIKWFEAKSVPEKLMDGSILWTGYLHDVTEAFEATNELRESEKRFRDIADNINEWIWEIDDKGKYTYASPSVEKVLGYSQSELLGKYFYDFFHPDDKNKIKKEAFRYISRKKPFDSFVNRCVRKDGRIAWLVTSGVPVFNRKGELTGYRGADRDITELIVTENLQSAELRLIEYSLDHTVSELLTKFLDEAEELTGSKIGFYHFLDEDQETISLQAWSTNTQKTMCSAKPDSLHYSVSQAGVWVDCIRERRPVIHNDYESLEHKKGMPDGHAPVVRELVVPVLRANKIQAILGVGNKKIDYNEDDAKIVQHLADVAWEIVVRKRSEAALKNNEELNRLILENINDAVLLTDSDGNFTYVCKNVDIIFGYNTTEVYSMGNINNLFGSDVLGWFGSNDDLIENIDLSIKDKTGQET